MPPKRIVQSARLLNRKFTAISSLRFISRFERLAKNDRLTSIVISVKGLRFHAGRDSIDGEAQGWFDPVYGLHRGLLLAQ